MLYGPILIGLRGSGKSAIAPYVARKLKFLAVDSDRVIEQKTGISIRDIIYYQGEPTFRRIEAETLLSLLSQPKTVIATGGGAVLHQAVRDILRQRFVIWLHAPLEVLAQRIRLSSRPSLSGKPIDIELAEQAAARHDLYAEVATLSCDTSHSSALQAARWVVKQWRQQVCSSANDLNGCGADTTTPSG